MSEPIAETSIPEGLDFACHLVAPSISMLGDAAPERAAELLRKISQYITLRYVGEDELAYELLTYLGNDAKAIPTFRRDQFWCQMAWIAEKLNLPNNRAKESGPADSL